MNCFYVSDYAYSITMEYLEFKAIHLDRPDLFQIKLIVFSSGIRE